MADLDRQAIDNLMDTTKENVAYINDISDKVVKSYTGLLDDLMRDIYNDVVMKPNASDAVLEQAFLKLTNTLYFMGEKLEKLGLHDDISKAQFKEAYNKAYLEAQTSGALSSNKPTVAMLTIAAENGSVNETVVNAIYARSYKIFKFKVDSGFEMVKTLAKIISKRMTENQLQDTPNSFKKISNEDVTTGEDVF